MRLEKLRDEKPGTSCFSRLMSGLPSELKHLTWKGRSGSIQKVSCLVLGSAKVFASDYKDLFSPNSMSETRAPAHIAAAKWKRSLSFVPNVVGDAKQAFGKADFFEKKLSVNRIAILRG